MEDRIYARKLGTSQNKPMEKWRNFINMCLLHNDSHKRTLLAQVTNSLHWIYYIGAQTGHENQGQDQAADPRS